MLNGVNIMFNKKITLFIIILAFILSISAVSAADTNSSDDMIASNVVEEPPSEASIDISNVDNLTATSQNSYELKSSDLNMYERDGSSYNVTLLKGSSPVKDASIVFSIKGVNYTYKTNNLGVASLPIGLYPGNYQISAYYGKLSTTNTIVVSPIVTAKDLNMFRNSGDSFTAKFLNNKGKALANTDITFRINGRDYTKQTNSKGVASLPIGLYAGSYVIYSIHPNGAKISNNILVVEAIKAKDLTLVYNSGSSYTAEFFTNKGKALANKDVILSIKGRNYTKTTDSKGVASLPIGLYPGSYVITAIHPSGIKLSTKIVVKNPTVVASDLTKHYSSSKHFTAIFYGTNGKPLANKQIKFYAKGTTFYATTNSNGQSTLRTISGPNTFTVDSINTVTGDKVTNTVTVLPTLYASSMTVFSDTTSKFKVTLYHGESLAKDTSMNVYVDGTKKTVKTDSNGVATVSFKLAEGTHTFKSVDPFTDYTISTKVYVKAPTITASDVKATPDTDTKFKATLLDDNGNVVPSTKMQITINGVTKTVKTNTKGVATYTFNLPEGTYSAVCKDLSNGYTLTKKITVAEKSATKTYDKNGVSDDGKTILAIGRASASGEYANYGYDFYKAEFDRTCPYCGSHDLYWSIFFAGNEYSNWGKFPATGNGEGSSAEGIIICAHCDSDWSAFGHNHGGYYDLTCIKTPTKTTKADAYKLLEGNYVLA